MRIVAQRWVAIVVALGSTLLWLVVWMPVGVRLYCRGVDVTEAFLAAAKNITQRHLKCAEKGLALRPSDQLVHLQLQISHHAIVAA